MFAKRRIITKLLKYYNVIICFCCFSLFLLLFNCLLHHIRPKISIKIRYISHCSYLCFSTVLECILVSKYNIVFLSSLFGLEISVLFNGSTVEYVVIILITFSWWTCPYVGNLKPAWAESERILPWLPPSWAFCNHRWKWVSVDGDVGWESSYAISSHLIIIYMFTSRWDMYKIHSRTANDSF